MGKSFRRGSFSTLLLDGDVTNTLENIANVIMDEYDYKGNNFVVIRTLLKAFLLKLIQLKSNKFTGFDFDEKRVYHFLLLLENHYKEEKAVDFYADRLNITSKRLNQILKAKLGKTIRQLLHERIMIEAKHQVIVSKQAIKEISYNLGFEDRSYFSRFFKKMTGQTPEEFHKQAVAQASLS
jgi:AraC-like DNA-binding protein